MGEDFTHLQVSALCNHDHLCRKPFLGFRNNFLVVRSLNFYILVEVSKGLELGFLHSVVEFYFWRITFETLFSEWSSLPTSFARSRSSCTSEEATFTVDRQKRSWGSGLKGFGQVSWSNEIMLLMSVSSRVIPERCKSLCFGEELLICSMSLRLPEEGASISLNQLVLADGIGF